MSSKCSEWNPARLLSDRESPETFALLILNQPLKDSTRLRKLWAHGTYQRDSVLMAHAESGLKLPFGWLPTGEPTGCTNCPPVTSL